MQLAGVVFQACSIDHSDISPFRINDLRTVRNSVAKNPSNPGFLDAIWFQQFAARCSSNRLRNCVRPSRVVRSLTAILMPETRRILGLLPCRKADDNQRSSDRDRGPNQIRCARSLPLDLPEPDERRSDVNPAVRGVGAARERRIGARQCHREPNEVADSSQRQPHRPVTRSQAQNAKQPAISRKAATTKTSMFFMACRTSRLETHACPRDRSGRA